MKPIHLYCVLVSAVLVGLNPTIPPQCGREPHLSFFDATLETETSLGRSPVSFDVGGSSFVVACVSENRQESRSQK